MRYIQALITLCMLSMATDCCGSTPWDYCAELQEQLQQQAKIVRSAAELKFDTETKEKISRMARKLMPKERPILTKIELNSDLFPDFINILFRDYEQLRQLPWKRFRQHFLYKSQKSSPFQSEACLEIYLSSLIQLEQLNIVKDGASGTYHMTAESKLEKAYSIYASSLEQSPTNPYNKREAVQELTDTRSVKKAGGPQKYDL